MDTGRVTLALAGMIALSAGCSGEGSQSPAGSERRFVSEISSVEPGSGKLEYRLVNDGSAPVLVRDIDALLGSVRGDFFNVWHNGERLEYAGIHLVPVGSESHVLTLNPGEEAGVVVDLSQLYNLSEIGTYLVEVKPAWAMLADELGNEEFVRLEFGSSISVTIDGEHRSEVPKEPLLKFNSATSCSNQERSAILNSEALALTIVTAARDSAVNVLVGAQSGTSTTSDALWEEYFGGIELSRAREVADTLVVIETVLAARGRRFQGVDYRCLDNGAQIGTAANGDTIGCGPAFDVQANAATNGADGDLVKLCPSFFSLSDDARAGVIAHEISHHPIEVVGGGTPGTDDIPGVVNEVMARALATVSPEQAIDSAENYEHYVQRF